MDDSIYGFLQLTRVPSIITNMPVGAPSQTATVVAAISCAFLLPENHLRKGVYYNGESDGWREQVKR